MRRPLALFVVVSAFLTTGKVLANGRYPEAQRLLEHPGDPNRLYLTATYGLLLTRDRGASWYYICERAFALKFLEGDPLLEVLADGGLLGGIFETENLSSDCGCTWTTVLGEAASDTVLDVAVDSNGVLIAAVRRDAALEGRVVLVESPDHGRTWQPFSELPVEVTDAFTIDVATADSSRIYLSGYAAGSATGVLVASHDRGQTWQQLDIPGTDDSVLPFIAAVHPKNPDQLFVRIDRWDYSLEFAAQDSLLHSDDGGRTWTEVIRRQAKLFGFALSPDGNTLLVGYGDPIQAGGRTTNHEEFGVYRAATADLVFEKVFSATVTCLRWTATGVYVCTVPNHPDVPSPGMALGFAPEADFTLATARPFTSLLDLPTVRGPLGCLAAACSETWTAGLEGTSPVCAVLGADCRADIAANNPPCPSTATGAGGGSGDDAGAGGGRGDGSLTSGGDAGGCACGLSATSSPASLELEWLAITGIVMMSARRRRRSQRARTSFDGAAAAAYDG